MACAFSPWNSVSVHVLGLCVVRCVILFHVSEFPPFLFEFVSFIFDVCLPVCPSIFSCILLDLGIEFFKPLGFVFFLTRMPMLQFVSLGDQLPCASGDVVFFLFFWEWPEITSSCVHCVVQNIL